MHDRDYKAAMHHLPISVALIVSLIVGFLTVSLAADNDTVTRKIEAITGLGLPVNQPY